MTPILNPCSAPWKIIARHRRWAQGCTITESHQDTNPPRVRFTATILGWRNWKIYEGYYRPSLCSEVAKRARLIRDRVEAGDDSIFTEVVQL